MATLSNNSWTLGDFIQSTSLDGSIQPVVELLDAQNSLASDITFIPSNGPTYHTTMARTGLPKTHYRKFNKGIPPSKATTAKFIDGLAMAESYFKIDKALADLNENTAEWRLGESLPFIESMTQTFESNIFYGTTEEAEQFNGLSIRYSDLSANSGENIIDADPGNNGVGATNSSIWLICFAPFGAITGIYPKGSTSVGIERTFGTKVEYLTDEAGDEYQGYRDHYKWTHGLAVQNWKKAVRICNINLPNLESGTNAPDLIKLMGRATTRLGRIGVGRAYFYMAPKVMEHLKEQYVDKSLTLGHATLRGEGEADPQYLARFEGIPVRMTDGLVTTEEHVN